MKPMQITVLMPDTKTHAACRWLEQNGALSMSVRALPNGEDAKPVKTNGANYVERGKNQQEWLVKHITKRMTGREIGPAWRAAGFPPTTLYNALNRSFAAKLIKRVKPGIYEPRS